MFDSGNTQSRRCGTTATARRGNTNRSADNHSRSYKLARKGRFSAALKALSPPPLGRGNSNWAEYRLTLKLTTGVPVDSHDLLALFLPRLTKIGKENIKVVAAEIDRLLDRWRQESGQLVLDHVSQAAEDYDWRDWDLATLSGVYGKGDRAVIRTICFGASVALQDLAYSIIREAENLVRESLGIPHVRERKNKPRKARKPRVAMPGYVCKESLPYPHVHYSGPYGTFLAFSEYKDSAPALCACSRDAVENLIEILKQYPDPHLYGESDLARAFSSRYLPTSLATLAELENWQSALDLPYKEKLCHRCNMATPQLRYCHEMYGGVFMQHHGWYVKQMFLRWGVLQDGSGGVMFPFIEEICPSDVKRLVQVAREDQKAHAAERDHLGRAPIELDQG